MVNHWEVANYFTHYPISKFFNSSFFMGCFPPLICGVIEIYNLILTNFVIDLYVPRIPLAERM